ncbi:MAG: hypothetical protein JWO38_1047 [Gemmataceae bacterium]|nr:hypothetical protein [Gemmataceae bacterium]
MPAPRPRAALALVVCLAAPAAARADNLDVALVREVWAVQTFLAEHQVKNVGVLNFRVQKGNGHDSFGLGSLSGTTPLRVETALVVTNDPKAPVGVIKDAAGVAARYKVAWFSKPEDRAKLFAHKDYPLAWGVARVKPDALLTGRIKVSDDLAKLTVTVEAILSSAPAKLTPVCTFEVTTDRGLLRELGQSYAAPRGVGKTRTDRDRQAVADAHRRDLAPGTDLTPDNVCGVQVRVLYDDVAQTPRMDDRSPGEWRVDPPQAGQKVAIEVSHNGKADGRRGVVLRVNGRSVWAQVEGPDDDPETGIWLVDAGKPPLTFKGFLTSLKGENLIPFRVLSEEESAAREAEFGDRVGQIDIDVCGSSPGGGDPDGEVLSISRGLSRSIKPATPAKTCEELRAEILKKNPLLKKVAAAPRKGGLIVGDDKAVGGPEIVMDDLPNRQKLGRLTIRYYDPKGSGAMQISK